MKIIVTGASTYGVDNMGDDAMFSALIKSLKKKYSKCEIVFLARHPSKDFDKLFGLKSIKNLDHDSNSAAFGRFFLGLNKGDNRSNLNDIYKELSSADSLIIGGNSLMEISENTFLRGVSTYSTTLATLALFLGIPYYLYGLNIVSPIDSDYVKKQAKFLVENAERVSVRERVVLEYLKKAKVETKNTFVTGDPAYGVNLEEVRKINTSGLLKKLKINLKTDRKIISLCVRSQYWKSSNKDLITLANKIARTVKNIKKNIDCQIIFIPNCYYEHGHPNEDDRLINDMVRKRIGNIDEVFFINKKLNLYETISIFQFIDLHISNRRHSNIFAALFGKPFISINTSHATHISAFVKDLGMTDMLIDEANLEKDVVKKINFYYKNNTLINKKLLKKVEMLVKNSHASTEVLFK